MINKSIYQMTVVLKITFKWLENNNFTEVLFRLIRAPAKGGAGGAIVPPPIFLLSKKKNKNDAIKNENE